MTFEEIVNHPKVSHVVVTADEKGVAITMHSHRPDGESHQTPSIACATLAECVEGLSASIEYADSELLKMETRMGGILDSVLGKSN